MCQSLRPWHVQMEDLHVLPNPCLAPNGAPYPIKYLNSFYTRFKLNCFPKRELVQPFWAKC